MFEIDLSICNEMMRYEQGMDELRALAKFIVNGRNGTESRNGQENLFWYIKHHAFSFARDIDKDGKVTDETVDLLMGDLLKIRRKLGITDEAVQSEHMNQLYKIGGFWEMRRFLGQFPDTVEAIAQNNHTHIICSAISGCVIGEYLGIKLGQLGLETPVDHIVFKRALGIPILGFLPDNFVLNGTDVLLVEDAVDESATLNTIRSALDKHYSNLRYSLFSLGIDPEMEMQVHSDFENVYTFEE